MPKTIFFERHETAGATMTDFGGWHMPLYYSGIIDEHLYTRAKAGLFDLCHMGRIGIWGKEWQAFLDYVLPANITAAEPGRVLYSFLLNPKGGVIDDVTAYVAEDYGMLVVNAANREKDLQWIRDQLPRFPGVTVEDWSDALAMLAVQGPNSDNVMKHFLGRTFSSLQYYTFRELDSASVPAGMMRTGSPPGAGRVPFFLYSATGYTGEHGYEIYCEPNTALSLWDTVLAHAEELEVRPIGLGARDSLRLEAAMPLYGHELTEETTPLEAGLTRFAGLEKQTEFIGKAALLKQQTEGVRRTLVGLEMKDKGPVPRHGYIVKNASGENIGTVTSGVYAPSLQKNIAFAYVHPDFSRVGTEVKIEIRNRLFPAQVVKRPFYRRSS